MTSLIIARSLGATFSEISDHRPVSMTEEEIREAEVLRILRENNYYRILNVAPEACKDPKILKNAFRKIALKIHPDKCQHNRASEAFQKASKAYDVLGDERKRAMYDQFGDEEPRRPAQARRQQYGYYPQDPFEAMFEGMFRAHAGARRPRQQEYQEPDLGGLCQRLLPIILVLAFALLSQGGLSFARFSKPFSRDKLKGVLSFENIPGTNTLQRHSAKYRAIYYVPSWWLSQIGGVHEGMLRELDKFADTLWEEEIEIQCELEVNLLKSEGKKCAAMKRALGRGRRAN